MNEQSNGKRLLCKFFGSSFSEQKNVRHTHEKKLNNIRMSWRNLWTTENCFENESMKVFTFSFYFHFFFPSFICSFFRRVFSFRIHLYSKWKSTWEIFEPWFKMNRHQIRHKLNMNVCLWPHYHCVCVYALYEMSEE